jgi:uncharacterized protein
VYVTALDIFIAIIGLFLAGIVKGATGIGYATCALPFLVVTFGLKIGMAILTVPAVLSNFAVLGVAGQLKNTLQRFWPFYASIVPGIACGMAMLALVDVVHATQILGAVTLLYVGLAVVRPEFRLPSGFERPLALPAGFLNGVLTGLTGSQVMPLIPYMMALKLPSDEQVQAVNISVIVASITLLASLCIAGVMTPNLLAISCLGAIPALLGVRCGDHILGKLPALVYRRLTLLVLAAIAVSLLMRVGAADTSGEHCTRSPDQCLPHPRIGPH